MNTILQPKMVTPAGLSGAFSRPAPQAAQVRKLKIKELISWSVCFAVVFGLTALLKLLRIGLTMDTVTTALCWISLSGLVFFLSRVILAIRRPADVSVIRHDLN